MEGGGGVRVVVLGKRSGVVSMCTCGDGGRG